MTLHLGDVVTLGGDVFVVATVTGLPPSYWALVKVPLDKEPLDLGKTWTRSDSELQLSVIAPTPPPPSNVLEPPTTPTSVLEPLA